jgi:CHAD domain-containing protein
MAHLSRDKPIGKSVGKQLRKRLDGAISTIEHARLSDRHVHEARKELKKARAYLRLVRPGLKEATYRRENTAMRDAARPLSTLRDARVLLDTLRVPAKRFGAPARALKLDGCAKVLKERYLQARREVLGDGAAPVAHSRALLRQSRRRVEKLRVRKDDTWATVGGGLRHIYAKGRRALATARDEQTAEAFHEWRKQTKNLRYALELLRPLWPGLIGELAEETHKLADYLGDEHDLTVLRETVLTDRECFADDASATAFVALLERCQLSLREESLLLGSRVYEEKPKAFARRFCRYWEDWRHETGATSGSVQRAGQIAANRQRRGRTAVAA